jgi:hypothetical protein
VLERGKTLVVDAAPPRGIAPKKAVQALVLNSVRIIVPRGLDRTSAQDGTTARAIPAGRIGDDTVLLSDNESLRASYEVKHVFSFIRIPVDRHHDFGFPSRQDFDFLSFFHQGGQVNFGYINFEAHLCKLPMQRQSRSELRANSHHALLKQRVCNLIIQQDPSAAVVSGLTLLRHRCK